MHALLTYVAANGGVCLVRADGTHPVRLTPRAKVYGPSWSPRGRYLALERPTGRDRNGDPVTKIAVLDGRGRVRWRFGSGLNNYKPLWAPDGKHIEYFAAAQHSGGMSIAAPTGARDRGIAGCIGNPVGFCPRDPTWSADGQRLAFADRADFSSPVSIFSTRYDGSDRRLLVSDADTPAYSPVGQMLAYTGPNGSPLTWSLFVADADGANPHPLTPPLTDLILSPSWSPDAKRLAYVRVHCATTGCDSAGAVVVVPADGGHELVVASGVKAPQNAGPSWSPDGKLLAFLRGRALVVAKADGGGERTVVPHVRSTASPPSWRAAVALPAARRQPCPKL